MSRSPATLSSVAASVITLLLVIIASGCSTDSAAQAPGKSATTTSAQPHLLTPESIEDLTTVSDATLQARMNDKRKAMGRLMHETIVYAVDHSGGDLSNDSNYQSLLRQTKQLDTDLVVLEREVERRKASPAN